MTMRPLLMGGLATAALSFLIVTAPAGQPGEGDGWATVAPGLEFRTMDGGKRCRKGPTRIRIVRAEPSRWRFDIFHYKEEDMDAMTDIEGWQRHLEAPVVFNAGQYYPSRVPMGLFVKGGTNLGTPLLKNWKGILAGPRATIIDLDLDPFDPESTRHEILLQSFMILDRNGEKRVRRSDWHANRTVLAIDEEERLLVIHTEGAYTLWELADWLDQADLGVVQAMSMDGGFEAQICVEAGSIRYTSFGSWHVDDRGDHSIPGIHKSLPAVVALFPL